MRFFSCVCTWSTAAESSAGRTECCMEEACRMAPKVNHCSQNQVKVLLVYHIQTCRKGPHLSVRTSPYFYAGTSAGTPGKILMLLFSVLWSFSCFFLVCSGPLKEVCVVHARALLTQPVH